MVNLLLKLGGLQAFILVLFLIKKRANGKANKILAILVFLIGLSSVFYSFNTLEFYLEYPHIIRIDWGIPLLFGPLIYIYTKRFINIHESNGNDSLHFLPYCINIFILVPFLIKSSEEKIQILDYFTASITGGTDYYFYYYLLLKVAISIIGIWYAKKSLNIVSKYRKKLIQEFSNTEKIRMDWLRDFLYGFLVSSIIYALASVLFYEDRYPQFDYNVYYYLVLFVLIYIVSYRALSQPQIINFDESDNLKQVNINPTDSKRRIISSKKVELLNEFMISSRPYLNGELTASELANLLSISRHELSELLNSHINQNFYDFINTYRVEEFKQRLSTPENRNLTLLGIAFDSGFNSKTTFNTIFKKTTGLTPSQYKKSLK